MDIIRSTGFLKLRLEAVLASPNKSRFVLQEDGNHGCLHGNVRNPVVRPTVGVDEEDWLHDEVDMTLQDLRKLCSMA